MLAAKLNTEPEFIPYQWNQQIPRIIEYVKRLLHERNLINNKVKELRDSCVVERRVTFRVQFARKRSAGPSADFPLRQGVAPKQGGIFYNQALVPNSVPGQFL